jgi:hypothetical protein
MGRSRARERVELMKPLWIFMFCCGLAGCEQLAELDGSKAAEADGKAVGGACRHAGRALEDCYALNEKAAKAAVFNGWREMNDYMTQNKIDVVPPQMPKKPHTKEASAAGKHGAEDSKADGKIGAASVKTGPPLPNPLLPSGTPPVNSPATKTAVDKDATAQASGAPHAAVLPPGFPGTTGTQPKL